MHLRILTIGVVATFCVAELFWAQAASAAGADAPQVVLVECPNWYWGASEMSGLRYELCFDDIDHCAAASIGDQVCIPSLGQHDVWVTAIDDQGADPVYYDGDIASIERIRSADVSGDGLVALWDLVLMVQLLGETGDYVEDLDADGRVTMFDIFAFIPAIGKCISSTGFLYEEC